MNNWVANEDDAPSPDSPSPTPCSPIPTNPTLLTVSTANDAAAAAPPTPLSRPYCPAVIPASEPAATCASSPVPSRAVIPLKTAKWQVVKGQCSADKYE
ncbi:MAG: hypothetical protein ROW48_13715 [Bellilinea sp.]